MTENIQNSEKLILLLSPRYHESEECLFQALFALSLSPTARTKAIIPVIMKRPCFIPEVIRHIVPVDLDNPTDRANEWKKLMKALLSPSMHSMTGTQRSISYDSDYNTMGYFDHSKITIPTNKQSSVTKSSGFKVPRKIFPLSKNKPKSLKVSDTDVRYPSSTCSSLSNLDSTQGSIHTKPAKKKWWHIRSHSKQKFKSEDNDLSIGACSLSDFEKESEERSPPIGEENPEIFLHLPTMYNPESAASNSSSITKSFNNPIPVAPLSPISHVPIEVEDATTLIHRGDL